ncbi:MAG: universal stress protein [Cyanobacteria bacterium SZAS LIN-2]|nr:universal stress protein [Cyanobacteria bacterium SZAS LIN-2]
MKILIAVADQDSGAQLTEYAIKNFGNGNAEILILHVIEPLCKLPYMDGLSQAICDKLQDEMAQEARVLVRNLALRLRDEYHSTKISEKVLFGGAADMIIDAALAYEADLIIVGCRRLDGLARLVASRVSTAVMERARCAVLVMRDKKARIEAGARAGGDFSNSSVTVYV